MVQRKKFPIGAGGYFVLTPRTLRYEIDNVAGKVAAELLVNAAGYGAIVVVPPGCKVPDGERVARMGPLEAVELLRRVNLFRLSSGRTEFKIPPALIKRAKADVAPGIEALVAFPGQLKTFYEGRGSWADTGLWVSAGGECALEMQSAQGYIRKLLSQHDAELWLKANGHTGWLEPHGPGKKEQSVSAPWEIVTRGSRDAGRRTFWAFPGAVTKETATEKAVETKLQAAKDKTLRSAVAKAKAIPAPSIKPPRKPRKPSRKR